MHFEFGKCLTGDSEKWLAVLCFSQMMAEMMFTQDESLRRTCLTHFSESYLPKCVSLLLYQAGIAKQIAICCFQLQKKPT